MKCLIRRNSLVILLLLLLSLTGCSSAKPEQTNPQPQTESGQPIVIKIASPLTPKDTAVQGLEKFKEIVEKNSSGRVEVQIFHSGQMGGEREIIESLKIGSLDMALCGTALLPQKFKILDLPYLFTDRETAYKTVDGEVGKELLASMDATGLKGLYFWENGFRNITNSKRPIYTPDDVKGLKLRVPENKYYLANLKALGANPVTMSFSEVFSALQAGVVDGQENPLATIYASSLYEVQKYAALTKHMWGPFVIMAGQKSWDKLPQDIKDIVTQGAQEAGEYQRKLSQEADTSYVDKLKEKGMTVTEPDLKPFVEATKGVYDMFLSDPEIQKDPSIAQLLAKIRPTK